MGDGAKAELTQLAPLRDMIDGHLDRATTTQGWPETLRAAVRYSLCAGGKRLRPVLALVACKACGGDAADALPVAAAVEMVHTYSLIHDDLPAMDDDDLRRGRPSNHKVFGEAVAILAGDALLTLAFETISASDLSADIVSACVLDLARAAGADGMVGGQTADIQAEQGDASDDTGSRGFSVQDLESIHRRKTGRLLTSALTMGARAGCANENQIFALERYGERVGLAFQITDDLLDIRGDAQKIGKRVRKDLESGKLTYPGLLGEAASQQRAEKLIREACDALSVFDNAEDLRKIAQFVLTRER